MSFADSETTAHALAPVREYNFRFTPRVLHDADVPDPDAVREARAHRLDDRLLGCKSHGDESLRPLRECELHALLWHQEMVGKAVTKALECMNDAFRLEHINPDAKDHARAAAISAFMSRTAISSPSNTARAMIACPMLSSTISRIAATGWTL